MSLQPHEQGSHALGVDMADGGDGDTRSSRQWGPQSILRETVPVGRTVDNDGKGPVKLDNSIDGEETASTNTDFAVSLMEQCTAQLSLSKLDIAVSLFRQVIDSGPTSSILLTDAMRSLASALRLRFFHTNHMYDLRESLVLRTKVINSLNQGLNARHHTNPAIQSVVKTDTQDKMEQAKGLLTDFRKSISLHVLNDIISSIQKSLPPLSVSPISRFLALTTLVDALYARFNHFHDKAASNLDEAISSLENAINCCTEQNGQQSKLKFQMCVLLVDRFDLTENICDLEEALAWLTKGNNEGTDNFTRIRQRHELAQEKYEQFSKSGDVDDLNTAVTLFRQAIKELPQGSEDSIVIVNNLANALWTRFQHGGERSDLDEAIALHRQALELRPLPHPLRASSLNNLASVLWAQFQQGGERSTLDEAISLQRQALELFLPPHPNRSNALNNLAGALSTRFQQGGEHNDLDESITLLRQAVELRLPPHPLRPLSLSNLAAALVTRFEQGGECEDLNEAISLHREALNLRHPSHPERSISLNNLASALKKQFEREGKRGDLDEAIFLHKQALQLRPPPHPDRSMSLNNLANTLWTRFEHGGELNDLDEAITLHRQSLELRLPPHPLRFSTLNDLATTLLTRFYQGGDQRDVNEAIFLHRQALEVFPPPHPSHSALLDNLANALTARFEQGGDRNDLNEAISLHRRALQLRLPPHPDQALSLNNLAISLEIRFRKGGEQKDLDEAISLHRRALELLLPPHSNRSKTLYNLANTLQTRFLRRAELGDIDEAISLYWQALELFLEPHPHRCSALNNLATALSAQFDHRGKRSDLDEAMSLFATATRYPFQSPSQRLTIAKEWIGRADQHQHSSAMAAYEAALQVLPQVAALSLDVQSRQRALTLGSDGLARDASRCAIRSGQLDRAVEFLEAGRSVFWSQVLSLRSPFDDLSKVTPDGPVLADKLKNIANALEMGSYRDVSADILDNWKRLSVDQEAARLNRLNEEWATTLLKVRELNGFEEFLLPPRLSTLRKAAPKHPVVLLIANEDQSHCLIMTSTIIHHIALPNLRTPILKVLADNIRVAVSQSSISRSFIDKTRETLSKLLGEQRGISYQNDNEHSDGVFKFVLRMLWDELVKPVIDYLNFKKSDDAPILQWCPTGYFTFLPIHAAGSYDDELSIDCAPDYFVSSYTPTIGALLAEPPSPSDTETFRMMAVIQSQELTSTKEELAKIRDHVSKDALVELGVPGSPAGVEAVASRLSDVSIVHFACHGSQEPSKPLDSWLKLDDGPLRISRIMREKMPNGALAFLCACETATGDENLPDEAMSIAASLIFCGFRRVVATMWAMMDKDGPTIADAFYRELFSGPDGTQALVPNVTRSAYALHVAVNELRAQNVSFRRWVPFIHMGQ